MKKSLSVAAALLLLALATTPAMAAHGGQMGLGLLTSEFPVGAFFGLNDKATFHVGIDVEKPKSESNTGQPKMTVGVVGALEYDMWHGDNWGFGVFPSIAFKTTSYEDTPLGASIDSGHELLVGLDLGGHFDPVSNVAIYFTHGVEIASVTPPGGGDSATNIATTGINVGQMGIAYFFK
ncbi:MAG: hypothetical protein U0167_05485 [bacterium]